MMATEKTDVATSNQLVVCQAWLPIKWSKTWPREAILEIKQNNVARLAWGCAK